MNSPLRPRLVQSSEELLQDYLDNLCAPLVGIVPYVERQSLRAEAEEHLLALIEDKEAQGLFSEAAVAAALIEYGEPYPLGQTLRETWCRGQMPRTRLARYTGAADVRAFAFFGAASVVNGLLVQVTALVPGWKCTTPYLFVLAVLLPLLAGLIFPVFWNAREAARRSSCQSNLRQIGVAIAMYVHDYSDTHPPDNSHRNPPKRRQTRCRRAAGTRIIFTTGTPLGCGLPFLPFPLTPFCAGTASGETQPCGTMEPLMRILIVVVTAQCQVRPRAWRRGCIVRARSLSFGTGNGMGRRPTTCLPTAMSKA